MRKSVVVSVICAIAAAAAGSEALADEHDNHQFVRHDEWHKGARIQDADWRRGEQVDYRAHHLRAPPNGYEWRLVDGNYVLAAVATGVIASVVAATIAGH
jgi:Ni/Co efflux regulator RcnB